MSDGRFYIRWTEKDIRGLKSYEILTEVDSRGLVLREIGIDSAGRVRHRAPTLSLERGFFDTQPIAAAPLRNEVPRSRFERLWNSRPE